MRIALVHSFYSSRVPSGENVVVDAQAAVLRAAGHEVALVAERTDARLRRRTYPVEAAVTAATGLGPGPEAELRRFGPDVVHVHNLFPNFGTSWLRRWDGPLVATMHNYRLLCPAGSLFRDGHQCTLCPDGQTARPAVRHRCFQGNRLATVPVAVGTSFARHPVLQRADLVTTLSEGMSEVFSSYGVPQHRLRVHENFTHGADSAGPGGDSWVFAGRVEPEKGLEEVVAQWPPDLVLKVAGVVESDTLLAGRPGVELLGPLPRSALLDLMAHSRGLVFPSRWLEGMALVCLEALSVGTPVLAFDDIPAGHTVAETGAGLAGPRTAFPQLLREATATFPRLRHRSRELYETRYSAEAWLSRALSLYEEAITRSRSRG